MADCDSVRYPMHTMPLSLYNTLTKKKEPFTPLKKGEVSIYTCGPTVYGRPHIGNYSSFLMADLLCRWFEVNGFKVTHVKNITDVGHIVADQDEGEDKIETQAKKEKGSATAESVIAIAREYEAQYLEDEQALNMREPEHRPRATETIMEMIEIIEKAIANGHAYETDDGVYFSVQSFPDYGKLSGNTLEKLGELEAGVRVDVKESKKHPADFALWKKLVGENAHHVLYWDSPWGKGFPGWHIECSAMSTKFLGEEIDIHTGGEDNIFPHHECEIAQSEGASGKPFVHVWLHKRRVNFADQKMSKSLGNILTLPNIVEEGFSPLDLKFLFLSGHYRSHTQFTWKGLEDAKKARLKIAEWVVEVEKGSGLGSENQDFESEPQPQPEPSIQEYTDRFTAALDDDLNTPEAFAAIFDCITHTRKEGILGAESVKAFTNLLERTFACFSQEEVAVPEEVVALVNARENARTAGEYRQSDELRDQVLSLGFVIEDLPEGPRVVPKGRRE